MNSGQTFRPFVRVVLLLALVTMAWATAVYFAIHLNRVAESLGLMTISVAIWAGAYFLQKNSSGKISGWWQASAWIFFALGLHRQFL
jgi:hypothetical protein